MAKIIKISNNLNLGSLLAEIKKTEESHIKIIFTGEAKKLVSSRDLKTLRNFADTNGKELTIENSERLEKAGFVMGEDVTSSEVSPSVKQKTKKASNTSVFKGLSFSFGNLGLSKLNSLKIPLAALFSVLILLGAGGFILFYYFHKANVTLTINAQVFTGSKEVTIDTEIDENSEEDLIIPGTIVSATIRENMVGVPTGEKEIGTEAGGEIEVFNKTENSVTIDEGTTVTITNNNDEELVFVTTQEIEVPEKTTGPVEVEGNTSMADVFGNATTGIIAEDIGDQFNIDSDNIKSIEVEGIDNDNVYAEIEGEPSGGESEQVTIVLEKDLEDLREKLINEIEKDLITEIENKTLEDQKVLEGAVKYEITAEQFNREVEEEASEIEGEIEMTAQGLVYNETDVREVLEDSIKSLVPENYSISDERDKITVSSTVKELVLNEEGNPSQMILTSKIQSFVIPKVDKQAIKNDIAGLSLEEADEHLSNISNIVRVEINLNPNTPLTSVRLPQREENINIQIETVE